MCELNCARLVILILHVIANGFCGEKDVFSERFSFFLLSLFPCTLLSLPLPLFLHETKRSRDRVGFFYLQKNQFGADVP